MDSFNMDFDSPLSPTSFTTPLTTGVVGGVGGSRKAPPPPALRNLQPRAAAALDFNDDSDEDESLLSADYKAQRRTTQDLVDFFKSAPPPSPPKSLMTPVVEEEKKKRSLLQRLRPRKSGGSLTNGSTGSGGSINLGNGDRRSSILMSGIGAGTSSNISTMSGPGARPYSVAGVDEITGITSKNGEEIASPTGSARKYIMISVDYNENERSGPGSAGIGTGSAMAALASNSKSLTSTASSIRRLGGGSGSSIGAVSPSASSKRTSILSSALLDDNGADRRRSIVLQSGGAATGGSGGSSGSSGGGDDGGGEGSKFMLDSSPFLLDSFAIDTNFIAPPSSSNSAAENGSASTKVRTTTSTSISAATSAVVNPKPAGVGNSNSNNTNSNNTNSNNTNSNKVTFNQSPPQLPMDEAGVTEALAERLASHKAKSVTSPSTTYDGNNCRPVSSSSLVRTSTSASQDFSEIVLPKPVSRKKVRHVQIQTQHCIMRPMHTQTEPYESLVQDLEVKDWSLPRSNKSMTASTEIGTSTSDDKNGCGKVANMIASLNSRSNSAATSPISTTAPFSFSDTMTKTTSTTAVDTSDMSSDPAVLQQEVAFLRNQNAQLQNQVSSLQRDVAAETRARTRTAVAMQDTRDKFEMLSAMAYKKLKEMIFQRHVLEMEVRELRAQVDLQSEVNVVQEGEMLFRQEQLLQQRMQQAA
ncbi:hypothetical protein BGX28_006354 [Mortierella sp. GBA30]|nr:hypothetical protein BGX28_006354 [Mortierella sp. GBA30]